MPIIAHASWLRGKPDGADSIVISRNEDADVHLPKPAVLPHEARSPRLDRLDRLDRFVASHACTLSVRLHAELLEVRKKRQCWIVVLGMRCRRFLGLSPAPA